MGKRIVIALGGNALGKNLHEQMDAVHVTAKAIADLIEDGHEVVIAHGNGPQVGMIQNAFAAYHKQEAKSDIMPLSVCVAMSQGYIGYDLQNMIGEELDRRGLGIHCATVLTQVAVNPEDPAFQHPTKPIGAFMTEEEAKKLAAEKLSKALIDAIGCSESHISVSVEDFTPQEWQEQFKIEVTENPFLIKKPNYDPKDLL